VFVAVLGASSYTFTEATWTQSLSDWIGSHVRALEFFGGAAEVLVPDNLRAAVTKPHLYEPDLNATYHDMATHYGMAIVPARVAKPRDKAKAEVGVQVVERWILAVLRNRVFFSLAELNFEIAGLLQRLNARPFRKLPGSRQSAFDSLDRPALTPLPQARYAFAEWKKVRVHIDYHVELERHYYSVPHGLVGKQLMVRYTDKTVECLHRGERVASHVRSAQRGHHSTIDEHMPERHRHAGKWSPERLAGWARDIGPATGALIERVLSARRHPEQSYRSCLGILRLGKGYTNTRLEAACRYALTLGTQSVRSVESILKHRIDEQHDNVQNGQHELPLPAEHDNLRGPNYYQ
jgi:transposase